MKWEYRVLTELQGALLEHELNKLGGEGWEAIGTVSALAVGEVVCVLKRAPCRELSNEQTR